MALVPSTTATPSPPASPPATSADPDDVPRWARTRQCNRFIDAANASQEVFGTVAAAVGDAEAMADRRDAIVAGAREVEEVRITIPALVELQRRWVDGVYLLHDALRAFDDLSDPDRIAAASERLKANGDAMSELIDEVNAYCSGED